MPEELLRWQAVGLTEEWRTGKEKPYGIRRTLFARVDSSALPDTSSIRGGN